MTRTRAMVVTEGETRNVISEAAKLANAEVKEVLVQLVADGLAVMHAATESSGKGTRMYPSYWRTTPTYSTTRLRGHEPDRRADGPHARAGRA